MTGQEDRSYTKENVKTVIIEYYANYESASASERTSQTSYWLGRGTARNSSTSL